MAATVTATDHLLLHFARNGGARDGDIELLVLERGEGVFVIDSQGRRHLDGLSNLFCAQLGYGFGSEMAEKIAEGEGKRALLQRTADGAEIARTVMFFAGPESRNITGETLLSDSGLHLSMAGARR